RTSRVIKYPSSRPRVSRPGEASVDFQGNVFLEALTSQSLIRGVQITVALTVVSFAAGLVIGLILAVMRDSRLRVLRWVSWTSIWISRAIPTLIQLFIFWQALPQLFPALREQWFSPFLASSICLALNEAAYAAEILRGGLLSVDE